MKFWASGAMVAALGAMTACGSSSGGAGGGTSASSGATSASSSSVGAQCAMTLTNQECFNCCEMAFLMENVVLIGDLVEACACAAPDGGVAPCASNPSCQMECTDKVVNDTCIMCINTNAIAVKPPDPCVAAGYKVCQGDPACAPLLECAFTYCTQMN